MNQVPDPSVEFVMILTTVDDPAKARMIANELVKRRAAACVQIDGPITSVYSWKGELESSVEYRLIIKSSAGNEAAAYAVIQDNHPYDIPQIVTVPIASGYGPYLEWIQQGID